MINRYTVVGQPIAHSLSPAIHHMFGEMTQRKIHYTRTESTAETFEQTVRDWQAGGGRGCNITAPFKQQALAVCDRLHESASLAQAVNTIDMRSDGTMVGYNTDGSGLLTDIEINKRVLLQDKRILMMGAGGAARGVLAPLLAANPAVLCVANRTVSKATDLANSFAAHGPVTACDLDELETHAAYDVLINATSMGFDNETPQIPDNVFSEQTLAYDMMYRRNGTPFTKWCQQQGIQRTYDGFGMLVEQAADAFLIWEGVRPKTRMLYRRAADILENQ